MENVASTTFDRPNTVSGLVAKRKELTKLLKDLRADQRKVISDLDHIDAAIRLFDPDADVARHNRYPTKHRAKKGEVVRLVVLMLKGADQPLTAIDIVHRQIKERGLKPDDSTVVLLRKRVGACLTKLKSDGWVRRVDLPGLYKGWEWNR